MADISKTEATRNVIIFTLLVNGLAWLGPLLGGTPTDPGLGLLVWGIAPILSALIMHWIRRDPVQLGWQPKWRGNGVWYLLSFLIYPLSILFVVCIGRWLGTLTISGLTATAFLTAMAQPVIIYFIFAIFEEVGWRGYLTPRVQEAYRGWRGYVLIGIIWASWHFPYMRELWAHTDESLLTLLPRFVLGTIISTVVYGEIRLRTKSVWPAVFMHWTGNTIANTLLLGFVTYTPGWTWVASFGVGGLLMMAIFFLIGTTLYRRRATKSVRHIQHEEPTLKIGCGVIASPSENASPSEKVGTEIFRTDI